MHIILRKLHDNYSTEKFIKIIRIIIKMYSCYIFAIIKGNDKLCENKSCIGNNRIERTWTRITIHNYPRHKHFRSNTTFAQNLRKICTRFITVSRVTSNHLIETSPPFSRIYIVYVSVIDTMDKHSLPTG